MKSDHPDTALPGSSIVVKIGGTQGVDFAAICKDAAGLVSSGVRLVLVHGGSQEADGLGAALGYPARTIQSPSGHSSRYTDRRTLEIFSMAVNGKLNTLLVESLHSLGVNALGLCGMDGRLLVAERKTAIINIEGGKRKVIRDDFSGKIESVNTELLLFLLEAGYTPVVAPLAISTENEALNVDADRAAAMIAGGLGAQWLVLLTAVPGLLRNYPDEGSLIRTLDRSDLSQAQDLAAGRMKKKVLATAEALEGGVSKVIIADGRIERPITTALSGSGTLIQ